MNKHLRDAKSRHRRLREIAAEVLRTEKQPLKRTADWLAKRVKARAANIEELKDPSITTIKRALGPVRKFTKPFGVAK
jgi:hypothetical protein